jgi:hypothetical protein
VLVWPAFRHVRCPSPSVRSPVDPDSPPPSLPCLVLSGTPCSLGNVFYLLQFSTYPVLWDPCAPVKLMQRDLCIGIVYWGAPAAQVNSHAQSRPDKALPFHGTSGNGASGICNGEPRGLPGHSECAAQALNGERLAQACREVGLPTATQSSTQESQSSHSAIVQQSPSRSPTGKQKPSSSHTLTHTERPRISHRAAAHETLQENRTTQTHSNHTHLNCSLASTST